MDKIEELKKKAELLKERQRAEADEIGWRDEVKGLLTEIGSALSVLNNKKPIDIIKINTLSNDTLTKELELLRKMLDTTLSVKMEDRSVTVLNLKEIAIPEPAKSVKVSNLSDIKIPDPLKIIEVKEPKWFSLKGISDDLSKGFSKVVKALEGMIVSMPFHQKATQPIAVKLVSTEGKFYDAKGGGGGAPAGGLTNAQSQNIASMDEKITGSLFDYKITEINGDYYGFVNADGAWFIMYENDGAWRYLRGDSDFPTAWTNRVGAGYDYISNIF